MNCMHHYQGRLSTSIHETHLYLIISIVTFGLIPTTARKKTVLTRLTIDLCIIFRIDWESALKCFFHSILFLVFSFYVQWNKPFQFELLSFLFYFILNLFTYKLFLFGVFIKRYTFISSICTRDRFRIVTWNVGNSEPDCNTFEHLAFASVVDNVKADLIAFGYEHYYLSKIYETKSLDIVFKKQVKNWSDLLHFIKHWNIVFMKTII
jgi:hypothetical protein